MRPSGPAQARGFPTLLFEAKPPGDTENEQVVMRRDLALVHARLPLFEFHLPNNRRARPAPLHPVTERLQMAFVILPVQRKVVRASATLEPPLWAGPGNGPVIAGAQATVVLEALRLFSSTIFANMLNSFA